MDKYRPKQEEDKGSYEVDLSDIYVIDDPEEDFSYESGYDLDEKFLENPERESFEKFKDLLEGNMGYKEENEYREKLPDKLEVYDRLNLVKQDDSEVQDYNFMVVREKMPSGLFGWTRDGSGKVHVSDNLYSVDEKKTIEHEKTHLLHPGKDELTIRYINGDKDPENTVSSNYMFN